MAENRQIRIALAGNPNCGKLQCLTISQGRSNTLVTMPALR